MLSKLRNLLLVLCNRRKVAGGNVITLYAQLSAHWDCCRKPGCFSWRAMSRASWIVYQHYPKSCEATLKSHNNAGRHGERPAKIIPLVILRATALHDRETVQTRIFGLFYIRFAPSIYLAIVRRCFVWSAPPTAESPFLQLCAAACFDCIASQDCRKNQLTIFLHNVQL